MCLNFYSLLYVTEHYMRNKGWKETPNSEDSWMFLFAFLKFAFGLYKERKTQYY